MLYISLVVLAAIWLPLFAWALLWEWNTRRRLSSLKLNLRVGRDKTGRGAV